MIVNLNLSSLFQTNHGNSYGSISESRDMLEKIYGKQNAYMALIEALGHTGQVKARNLLTALYRINATETGLGLDAAEELLRMKVEFHGKVLAVKDLLPHLTLVSSLCVFHCPEKRMEFIQLRLQNKRISGLQRNVSKPHPLYRTRWLSTRSIVNPVSFRNQKYNDIFLFQGVSVNELSYLADPHNVQTSTDWCRRKVETCRFISLDGEDHRDFIFESSKGPVHLICKEGNNFVLLQTNNFSTQTNSWLRQEMADYVELSEASFVTNVLLGSKYQGVCFCHCSGEGKSLLLASLARKLQEQNPGTIYFLVELSKLAKNLRDFHLMTESYDGLLKLLEFCCSSKLNGFIMHQYVQQGMDKIYFFMDGLDELSIDSQKNMIKFLKDIRNNYPGRIVLIISSGVHSRNDLEKILNVTSFDILPFKKEDHIESLVQFWMLQLPNMDKADLILCANSMIQAITSLQRAHHKAIGTPLVCNLLALVYKEQVELFKHNRLDEILNFEKTSTILDLYDHFLETWVRRSNGNEEKNTLSTCSPNFLEQVTQYHTIHAVDSLFRDFAQACFQNITFAEDSELQRVINSGLSISPNMCLEGFLNHRSFFEFLSAKFFADFLMNLESQKYTFDFVKQVLLFFTQDVMTPMSFRQESLICINKKWKDMTITIPRFAMGSLPVFINSMLERNNCHLIVKETIGRMKKKVHFESASYATLKTNVYGIFLCCIDGKLNALLSLLVALIKSAHNRRANTVLPNSPAKLFSSSRHEL